MSEKTELAQPPVVQPPATEPNLDEVVGKIEKLAAIVGDQEREKQATAIAALAAKVEELTAAVAAKEGRTALVERDSVLVPATIGPEGYPVWPQQELSASGSFVRTQMRQRPTVVPATGE